MTLSEAQEQLDGWPESLDRFAEVLQEVEDCEVIKLAAEDYLKSEERLTYAMSIYGIELG